CSLTDRGKLLPITAHRGGSVLLPCSCTELRAKPETFTWSRYIQIRNVFERISNESDRYRNRVQLVNDHSPGNLSLLISHLTEEDGGEYRCHGVKSELTDISLTVEGCTLVNSEQILDITAHTGGSVLLSCSCTDLQTKPEEFRWRKYNRNTQRRDEISRESGRYRNRVQLFNDHSPGNLSLLISHLTEEDGGDYQCAVKGSYIYIRLTVKVPKTARITTLNDWRPVALTSIISKCFEKLVRDFICSSLPATLDPMQFAYRQNRSTDDAIALTLHTALSHLDKKNTYVRMLYVDYSSAFNTIIPSRLDIKLRDLGLNSSLCSWILKFLTDRRQVVKLAGITYSSLTLSTGAPQDDTTIVGLISNNNEEAYRQEVSFLTHWCRENNLSLNVNKTKELIVDFRKQERVHTPITINGAA
ncbi:hypothetical protein NFI96_004870, partial [Prochilodus magdalenae]